MHTTYSTTQATCTIYNGDAIETMQSLPDASIELILADTPYQTTQCKWDTLLDLDKMFKELNRITTKDSVIILTASQPYTSLLITKNIKHFKYNLVWQKEQGTNFLLAKKQPLKVHEDIVIFAKGKNIYYPQMREGKPYVSGKGDSGEVTGKVTKTQTRNKGTRYPISILPFKRETGLHPTQKPVALMEYLIKTYSKEGDKVLDFAMGSGSTLIAALRCNRDSIGIELDRDTCNIARERVIKEIDNSCTIDKKDKYE